PFAIQLLRSKVAAFMDEHEPDTGGALFHVAYFEGDFGRNLADIAQRVLASKVRNTIFNLDQYGHSNVSEEHMRLALTLTRSSEVFLTFSIKSFLAFISPN